MYIHDVEYLVLPTIFGFLSIIQREVDFRVFSNMVTKITHAEIQMVREDLLHFLTFHCSSCLQE